MVREPAAVTSFRRGYAAVFCVAAVIGPFVSYVLAGHGWGTAGIGTALALFTLSGTIGAPFWGWLDDRRPGRAAGLAVPATAAACLALSTVTVLAPENRTVVTVVLAGVGFFSGALESLVTAAVARARQLHALGSLRTAGSWGWIVGLVAATAALSAGLGGGVFALGAVAAGVGLPFAALLGPAARSLSVPGSALPPPTINRLLPLAGILLLGLPIPVATFTLMYFITGWVRTSWGSEPVIAVLPLILAAALEVPALLVADRLIRLVSPLTAIRVALFLLVLAWTGVATWPTLHMVLLVQPVVALMTACWLVGQAHAVAGSAAGATVGRDLALAAAAAKGGSAVLAGLGGGLVSQQFGIEAVFALEAALAAVALAAGLTFRARGCDDQTNDSKL